MNKLLASPIAHGVIAAIILLPFLFSPFFFHAAIAVTYFYYGREASDYRHRAKIDAHKQPFAELMVWKWHANSLWDFLSPLVVAIIYSAIYYFIN